MKLKGEGERVHLPRGIFLGKPYKHFISNSRINLSCLIFLFNSIILPTSPILKPTSILIISDIIVWDLKRSDWQHWLSSGFFDTKTKKVLSYSRSLYCSGWPETSLYIIPPSSVISLFENNVTMSEDSIMGCDVRMGLEPWETSGEMYSSD